MAIRTSESLIIDGRYENNRRDSRRLIIRQGQEVWIRQREFDYLKALARQVKRNGQPLPISRLPGVYIANHRIVISRLRQGTGLDIQHEHPGYRLMIDPGQVTIRTRSRT